MALAVAFWYQYILQYTLSQSCIWIMILSLRSFLHVFYMYSHRARRASYRQVEGFGTRRSEWHRHALSGYTWIRTDRGPQRSWLSHIGKGDNPTCDCGHPIQGGHHITFECARFGKERREILGPRRTRESLDEPNWRKEEGDDSEWDTIEGFLDFIYNQFS